MKRLLAAAVLTVAWAAIKALGAWEAITREDWDS